MLVNLKQILEYAEKHQCAIAAVDCPTFEMAIATIETAEECNVPVILAHAQVHDDMKYMKLSHIASIFKMIASEASVPVCIHLDHGVTMDYVQKAIELGFTSVMYDASLKDYHTNVRETKRIVEIAHLKNVSVEAELGSMPSNGGESGEVFEPEDFYTKPDEAISFINETGIDALAVSYGSVHGLYKSEPKLDFDILRKIREKSNIPLVLHGGSGLSDLDYINSIKSGVRKINYFTYMAYAGTQAVKDALSDPNKIYQFQELSMIAIKAMKENLRRVFKLFKEGK